MGRVVRSSKTSLCLSKINIFDIIFLRYISRLAVLCVLNYMKLDICLVSQKVPGLFRAHVCVCWAGFFVVCVCC